MTYASIAAMANDSALLLRVTGCAASLGEQNPYDWARSRMWRLASTPGWADKWEAPPIGLRLDLLGGSDDVIADTDILAAVEAIRAT